MRTIVIGAALIASLIAPARANSQLSGDQAVVAMAIDTAMFAAGHCPGLRYVKSAMFPNVQAAGVTEEQATGAEWKSAMFLGEINSKDGYEKNPSEFCDTVWRMLGPNPAYVKYQLLEKD